MDARASMKVIVQFCRRYASGHNKSKPHKQGRYKAANRDNLPGMISDRPLGLDGSAGAAAGREAPAELKWRWRVLFNLVRWADRVQKRPHARTCRSQIFPQTLEFQIGAAWRPRGNSWADAAR